MRVWREGKHSRADQHGIQELDFVIRLVLLLLSLRWKVNGLETATGSKEVKLFSQP